MGARRRNAVADIPDRNPDTMDAGDLLYTIDDESWKQEIHIHDSGRPSRCVLVASSLQCTRPWSRSLTKAQLPGLGTSESALLLIARPEYLENFYFAHGPARSCLYIHVIN